MQAQSESEPLAIIGFAFRFPQDATSSQGFWKIIEERRCVMTEMPAKRMNIDGFHHPTQSSVDKLNLRGGHFLKEDLGAFDAPFFSISSAEAAAMDPQQRGLLETTYHALENAGIPVETVSGSDTSVFTGSFGDDHRILTLKDPECLSRYAASSTEFSILANRISWWFNLKGPSMNIDTACSSSLVALHLACQSLRSRESSMALVGGSNVLSSVEQFLLLSNLSMLSPSSRSYSFDHRANGYARGEGFGIVVLKRLSDALCDGDVIRAVIRATGTNQDGKTPSLTAPSQEAQQALIRDTYTKAGLDLATTAFVEAHGTGTAMGDPIEAQTLGSVFCVGRKPGEPLYVGSVKSNIGHLEGGSGIASLIKVVLALEHGVIPPNANFEMSNPRIDTKELNIAFPTEAIIWPSSGLRRASVNSFGFGGSNSHIVLDDACNFFKLRRLSGHHLSVDLTNSENGLCASPGMEPWLAGDNRGLPRLLIWSASDNKAASRLLESYSRFFASIHAESDSRYLDELAFTLATRRSLLPSRSFALASSPSQLSNLSTISSKPMRAYESRRLGFIFTGQGAQYSKMGEQLLAYRIFKQSMQGSGDYLRELGCEWDLLTELARPEEETRIHQPEYSQPMCTALQVALVDLLSSVGVRPHRIVGHSSGEIAAAYTIGALSHRSAIKVAYLRGQAAGSLCALSERRGAMMAVGLAESQAVQYITDFGQVNSHLAIVVACINSPFSVTLAGDDTAIDALKARLDEDGVFARKLRVSVAYHSPHMTTAADGYRRLMAPLYRGVHHGEMSPIMVSSVTGCPVNASQLLNPDYWVQNMESPVIFNEAVTKAMSSPKVEILKGDTEHANFESLDILEIGPHSTLQIPFKDIVSFSKIDTQVHYDSVLRRDYRAVQSFLMAMGRLHCLGHYVDVLAVNNLTDQNCSTIKPLVNLPPYPFDHSKSYWHESRQSRDFRLRKRPRSDLLGSELYCNGPPQMAKRWRKVTRVVETPWVKDHVVNQTTIYPAAGMLSMVIEAARQAADQTWMISAFHIKEAHFLRPMYVSSHSDGVESHLELESWSWSGEFSSTTSFTLCTFQDETWIENCVGTIMVEYDNRAHEPNIELDALDDSLPTHTLSVDAVYKSFYSMGLDFGPSFRSLAQVAVRSGSHARSEVNVFHPPSDEIGNAQDYIIHPVTLDGIFQTILAALTQTTNQEFPTTVPTYLKDLWIVGTGAAYPNVLSLQATAEVEQRSESHNVSTALAQDGHGKVLVSVGHLRTTFVDTLSDGAKASEVDDTCYRMEWRPDIDLLDGCITIDDAQPMPAVEGDEHFDDLSAIFLDACMHVLDQFHPAKIDASHPHLRHYIQWMKDYVARFDMSFKSRAKRDSIIMDENLVMRLCEKASKTSVMGKGVVQTREKLLQILHGEFNPLELVFKSNFAEQYYQEVNARTEPALRHIMELIAFKRPGLKVLEVGAGTGATTELVLKYASIQGEEGTSLPAISSYEFTDISPAFLSSAKGKFAAQSSKMKFSILDISKDPIIQGFQEAHYDIIVAANVLHATPNLNTTLSNAHQLLKHDGKLLILEVTENQWVPQIMFGTLPGWWLSDDEYRTSGPCISSASWDRALSRNGFSGADIVAHDSSDPRNRICSVLVSSAVKSFIPEEEWPNTVILADPANLCANSLSKSLSKRLCSGNLSSIKVLSLSDALSYDFSNKFCISLLELTAPFLASMNEEEFILLRGLLLKVSGIVWVQDKGDTIPTLHMSNGLFRVLRSENANTRYVTLALSADTSEEKTVENILRVFSNTVYQPLETMEPEYQEMDGRLSINRVVPATSVENHIKNAAHCKPTTNLDPNATYIIAGGFGGIARSICRWMVKQGARHLLLISRSGPLSTAAQSLLTELMSQNVRVECPVCDISSLPDLQRVVNTSMSRFPPIKGCIQGALVLQDSIFNTMTHTQWTEVVNPRVLGTQNLFRLMPDLSLFILLSSVTGVIGNPSQANYSATNTYLDAFAQCHSTASKPVVSIDLGYVEFTGTVAESESIRQHLAGLGCLRPVSETEVLGLLDYVCNPERLAEGIPSQIITGIKHPAQANSPAPSLLDRPLWKTLWLLGPKSDRSDTVATLESQDHVPISSSLSNASSLAEATRIILQTISMKLAVDFGIEQDAIQPDKPLHKAGVDSLMALQLRSWFGNDIGADISVFLIMGNQSVRNVSKEAAEKSKWVVVDKT